MKNKYQRLPKEMKKQCRDEYYKTQRGKDIHIRLTRLNLIGLLGLLFTGYIFTQDYPNNFKWYDIFIMIILSICSIIFLIASFKLRIKNLNEYALQFTVKLEKR